MSLQNNIAYADLSYGMPMTVAPSVVRVLAANPKSLTYRGTNSYIVGKERLAIVDPGPALAAHIDAVLAAIDGRPVDYIFVTHSHVDHCGGAAPLKAATGARILGHGPMPQIVPGDEIERDYDTSFAPDQRLRHGERIAFGGHVIEAVHTPGHFPNHLCYALDDGEILFSGDHVMGWCSTVIAPPIGDVGDYLESALHLVDRDDRCYLPGHGPVIDNPIRVVRDLIAHRHEREQQIAACLRVGIRDIDAIVGRIYLDLHPSLKVAAAKSVMAHLLYLSRRGKLPHDQANDLVEAEGVRAVG